MVVEGIGLHGNSFPVNFVNVLIHLFTLTWIFFSRLFIFTFFFISSLHSYFLFLFCASAFLCVIIFSSPKVTRSLFMQTKIVGVHFFAHCILLLLFVFEFCVTKWWICYRENVNKLSCTIWNITHSLIKCTSHNKTKQKVHLRNMQIKIKLSGNKLMYLIRNE